MKVLLQLLSMSAFHSSDVIKANIYCFRSYEAAEDNELSFVEGDRVTEIEAASDDWWQGKDQHGNVGLFPGEFNVFTSVIPGSCYLPANYVEVQGN